LYGPFSDDEEEPERNRFKDDSDEDASDDEEEPERSTQKPSRKNVSSKGVKDDSDEDADCGVGTVVTRKDIWDGIDKISDTTVDIRQYRNTKNSTGYTGVTKTNWEKPWRMTIFINYRQFSGPYDSLVEAATAYAKAIYWRDYVGLAGKLKRI
jgi:hypothetical protein